MADGKKIRLVCPVCGAKRWTPAQLQTHILKKHGGNK